MAKIKQHGEVIVADLEDTPQVKIAVMNNDIKHINDSLGRIEGKFDTAIQNFVTNQQLTDTVAAATVKHENYEHALSTLQGTVERLQQKDSEQQGAIEANQKAFTRTVALITVAAAILSAIWWLPAILHAGH